MSSGSFLRGVPCGIHPSPRSATRRSAGLPYPPIPIGGGGWFPRPRRFAVPPDPDRRARLLPRPRPLAKLLRRPLRAGKHGELVGPRGDDRVDRLVGERAAIGERSSEHLELGFDVTG